MTNQNWMVSDRNNKVSDIVCHIRKTTQALSEEQILAIYAVSQADYETIKARWSQLPAEARTNISLGAK